MRKQDRDDYFMIDHRHAGAPQPDALVMKSGLPPGSGRGLFETALIACHCCQKRMIRNPKRTRPRYYCRKHDAYHCDDCAARVHVTGICIPWKQVRDMAYEAAIKGLAFKAPF